MRRLVIPTVLLALVACKPREGAREAEEAAGSAEEAAQAEAPEGAPEAKAAAKGPASQPASRPSLEPPPPLPEAEGEVEIPVTFEAKAPGAVCLYELKDVLTETLGDQLAGAHDVTLRYAARAVKTDDGHPAFDVTARFVNVEARLEEYTAKLSSDDPADMRRVTGGADTMVIFDAVLYFALLNETVRIHLDERGHLLRVEGGDAVREKMLALHPEKPREDPHQQGRVKLQLSDEAIAGVFFPSATLLPEEGPVEPGQSQPEKLRVDRPDYAAQALRGRRIRVDGGRLWVEEKRAMAPSPEASVVPKRRGFPKVALKSGKADLTVTFDPPDPCFDRAGASRNLVHFWEGTPKDQRIKTEQKLARTWLWTRRPAE